MSQPNNERHLRSFVEKTVRTKGEDGKPDKVVSTFVASTDCVDRYEDIISQDSWRLENYRANPVILTDHYYSVGSIVGRAEEMRIEEVDLPAGGKRKALVLDIEWDMGREAGAEVAGLVERGFAKAGSVGLRSHRMTRRSSLPKDHPAYGTDGYFLEENELYEYSIVAIGANQEALKRSARAKGQDFGSVDLTETIKEALFLLATDEDLWRKVEAKRLAAKAAAGEEPAEPPAPAPAPAEEPKGKMFWQRSK